jgi:hypothetical protein
MPVLLGAETRMEPCQDLARSVAAFRQEPDVEGI